MQPTHNFYSDIPVPLLVLLAQLTVVPILVVLHYIGDGKRQTGDWCFQDGFITFTDLTTLYLQLLRGRVLTIVSDCSHSGSWVRECMTFLDQQGVGPCGHKARDKGILLKVLTSCLSHQIPRQLAYSVHGCKNEKNTGELIYTKPSHRISVQSKLCDDQHSNVKDFTEVMCRGTQDGNIEEACLCLPDASWKKWSARMRTFTHKHRQDGRKAWHIIQLEDNDQAVLDYQVTNTLGFSGKTLMSAWGEASSKEEAESAMKEYAVYSNDVESD